MEMISCKNRVFGCQFHFLNDMHKKKHEVKENMREKFTQLCEKLCHEATTVSQYNVYKSRLDEIGKLYPAIGQFINWWHDRRSHIFPPFRGGGLPGVNLSEQGNAGWKPSATMRLVKAAKYDVATMLLQEKELFKFNRNLGTSSGKGPSQAVRDAKERKKQLQEAEDFVNILDDEEAILLEAQQANNPTTFIPKAVEKHRAKEDGPKHKSITSLANETRDEKGSRKKKRAKKSIEGPDEGKIREKIFLACEVLKMRYEEVIKLKSEDIKRQKGKENPPVVIITDGLGIHVCKGYPKGIQKDEQKFPRNMVFQCTKG